MTVRRLVGTAEITDEHGLSRGAVLRLLNHGEFPAPAAELRRSRVWYADEIDEWVGWARSHGRLLDDGTLVPWRFVGKEAS